MVPPSIQAPYISQTDIKYNTSLFLLLFQLGRSAAIVELSVTSTEEVLPDASILHCNDMARKLAMHIVSYFGLRI